MALLLNRNTNTQDTQDSLLHGAHIDCQRESPFVMLVCGKVANWEDFRPESQNIKCPMCYMNPVCPCCGMKLKVD